MRKQFLKRQNALAFYFRFEMTQQRRWLVLPCWLADNKKKQKGGGNAVFWGDQRLVPAALRFPPFSPLRRRPENIIFAGGLEELSGSGHVCPGIRVSNEEAIPHSAQRCRLEQRLERVLAERL